MITTIVGTSLGAGVPAVVAALIAVRAAQKARSSEERAKAYYELAQTVAVEFQEAMLKSREQTT